MAAEQIAPEVAVAIPDGFVTYERIPGIVNARGQKAGQEQNWGYKAMDTSTHEECILIYCQPGVFTVIDCDQLEHIRMVDGKQRSWFQMQTGYIGCHVNSTIITMHQLLTNHMGHGRGGPSVDHINQNKIDNRVANLRIVGQSIQNENRGKVARHANAKKLPEELGNIQLPKHIVYYKEKVASGGTREFFTVENHPLQKRKEAQQKIKDPSDAQTQQLAAYRWTSSKSNAIPIRDKLDMAIEYVAELNRLQEDSSYTMRIPEKTPRVAIPAAVVVPMPIKEPPLVEVMSVVEVMTPSTVEEKKESVDPKQWKIAMIHHAILIGGESHYLAYIEAHHTELVQQFEWPLIWSTFLKDVRAASKENAVTIIESFVKKLRAIRYKEAKKDKPPQHPILRDDRQQWPATTVVKAFFAGHMTAFKEFTEKATGESLEDPKWQARWNGFLCDLEQHRADPERMKKICSAFMIAQRTKKWRQSKNAALEE